MSKKNKSIILTNPELKDQLRDLLNNDFDKFLELLQVDDIQVVVCVENEKGLSMQQIANRLAGFGIKMTRQSVNDRCKKCQDKPDR